jgi:Rrf2 family transcriptional regulator, nitric oxide-sensitive transcriptional repressor
MRLTVQTDYALRTLMLLSVSKEPQTTRNVATHYGISQNHLVKVVQRLVIAGFIKSARGRGGGLQLAQIPRQINIGAVVRAIEDFDHFVECFDPTTNQCVAIRACGLKGILAGGIAAFLVHLDRYSLEDLVPYPDKLSRALGINDNAVPSLKPRVVGFE